MNDEGRRKLHILLHDIWAEFRASYYDNDQEIIAYLAYLLTKDLPLLTPRLESDRPRPDRHPINESKILEWLAEAEQILENEGGLATFFDRYILFQSSNFGAKEGAYPIPRHIIDFMLGLFSIKPSQRFADFACGTGGFLVHWHKLNPQHGQIIGIDISSEMFRLAEANAVLHGMTRQDTTIMQGDAFAVVGLIKPEALQYFERIAMAPSFGRSIDSAIAERLFGPKAGRNSELLFVRLALEKLTDDGIAIVMVPLSMGFTNVSQDQRRSLVEEHTLRAVITLDSGMLQPFSNQQIALWLIEKQPRTNPGYTWFFQIARDGYPLTADRDLTADPSERASDLPSVTAVMRVEATWDEVREFPTISLQEAQTVERVLLIKVREQATVFSIRHFPSGTSSSQSLVIQSALPNGPSLATIIPFNKDGFMLANIQDSMDFLTWRRQEFGPTSEEEDIADTLIFSGGKASQMIALTVGGRLLGFTKSSEEIAEATYRLNDNTYRDFHQTLIPIPRSVVQSLQEISTRQRIIAAHSENLLRQVEIKSLLKEALPPALLDVKTLPLLAYLDTEQQAIWDDLREKKTDEQGHAFHFTPADIPDYADLKMRVKINQTLQLLEALGLIVQVSIKVGGPNNERRLLCYRHVTTFDEKNW